MTRKKKEEVTLDFSEVVDFTNAKERYDDLIQKLRHGELKPKDIDFEEEEEDANQR